MVRVYRFAAVRPERSAAPAIAAVPYDVVTADEARATIAKNPKSFLRVSRSDAEFPHLPHNDDRVYRRARDNFLAMLKEGSMRRDTVPSMYMYRVRQDDETFSGLCCCLDVDDYRNNTIRKHEQTRYDKEEDRTRHIEITRTHNGPVVLLYRDLFGISSFIHSLGPPDSEPDAEVRTESGALHQIFRISDPEVLARLETLFAGIPCLYIADGHHRAKSAVNVADRDRIGHGGDEINRFMGVLFAHDRVRIHGYSRLLSNTGVYTADAFLQQLKNHFDVVPYGAVDNRGVTILPKIKHAHLYHVIHMYLGGRWYECSCPVDHSAAALDSLDVAVLQKYVLEELLGINDPRIDSRLQYLGGSRPLADLEHMVDTGEAAVAFALQPVHIDTILAIADADSVMPPKSTWFEPKLLSGLLVHTFE